MKPRPEGERMKFIRKTSDGRYGLVDNRGEHYPVYDLYRIPERGSGVEPYFVGCVSDPDNIETAADNADEEMRCLMADAREEFG